MGPFVAFSVFSDRNQPGFLVTALLLGTVFGRARSQPGACTAPRRSIPDFALVYQIVAAKYEVLVEHDDAAIATTRQRLQRDATV